MGADEEENSENETKSSTSCGEGICIDDYGFTDRPHGLAVVTSASRSEEPEFDFGWAHSHTTAQCSENEHWFTDARSLGDIEDPN